MPDHQKRVYDSILGLASNADNPTPIVRLNRVTPFEHTVVYAKLEWYNPFGAVKDRIAHNLILDAEDVVWAQLLPMCDGDVVDRDGEVGAEALDERELHEMELLRTHL